MRYEHCGDACGGSVVQLCGGTHLTPLRHVHPQFTSRLAKATHSNDGPQQPPAPLNAPITRIVEAVYMLCQGMLPGVALANLVMASVYPERTLFDAVGGTHVPVPPSRAGATSHHVWRWVADCGTPVQSFPAVAGGLRQIMYILAT